MTETKAPRRGLPIAWKIFLGTASVVVVAMGVSMWMSYTSALTAARANVDQQVIQAARTASTLLEGQQQSLMRSAATFAQNPVFRDVVRNGKQGTVVDQAREAEDRTGATWCRSRTPRGCGWRAATCRRRHRSRWRSRR